MNIKTTYISPHKSSLGMEANVAVLVMYIIMVVLSWISVLGWVTWAVPLVFFFLEKQSRFVKFQAIQALLIAAASAVVSIVVRVLSWVFAPAATLNALSFFNPGLGIWALLNIIAALIGIAFFLIELYVLFMAYNWKQVELPIIGPLAYKASMR